MGYGNTPLEEELGESLDQRLAQEIPERDPYAEAAARLEIDEDDTASEIGDARAGRLVEPDEGVHLDSEPELLFYLAVSLYESKDAPGAAAVLRRALPNLQRSPYVDAYARKILSQ